MKITNPILPGFNPDPSVLRVGDDFYIATSTFEWFPGIQIHHSKDLIHWKLITHPLNRTSQLNMLGNPNSCGVWAPCLSYDNGTFYLIYTDTKTFRGEFKDSHNYLVTAKNIRMGFYKVKPEEFVTKNNYEKIMTRGFVNANDVIFTTEGATLGFTARIPRDYKKRLMTEHFSAILYDHGIIEKLQKIGIKWIKVVIRR